MNLTLARLILGMSVFVAGCHAGKALPNDEFGGELDKSDAFSKRWTLVGGPLGFGETRTFDYANPPLYRALRVDALAGDTISARVSAPGQSDEEADPTAWLLNARYQVVAQNDDDDDTTVASLLEARDLAAGTYYIVVREYSNRPARFQVDLAARAGNDAGNDAGHGGALYWGEVNALMTSRLDGSQAHAVIGAPLVDIAQVARFYGGIAFDATHGQLYFTEQVSDTVNVANADGSNARVLYTSPSEYSNPGAIVLDVARDRMLWVEGGAIMTARLDGSDAHAVIDSSTTTSLRALAFDPMSDRLFFGDGSSDSVNVANIDGSNARALYRNPNVYSNPSSIAVDADHDRLVWTELGAVMISTTDGVGTRALVGTPLTPEQPGVLATTFYEGVAIDAVADQIYFVQGAPNTINVVRSDGTNARVVYSCASQHSNPSALVVVR